MNIRWTRELSEAMRAFNTRSDYVNPNGPETEDGSEHIKAAFG